MAQKTLADIAETVLAKTRALDIDTSLKLVIGGTEIGAIAITGKIQYVPTDGKGKTAK